MKKTVLFLTVAIVLILILIGVWFFTQNSLDKKIISEFESQCKDETGDNQDSCILALLAEKQDASLCPEFAKSRINSLLESEGASPSSKINPLLIPRKQAYEGQCQIEVFVASGEPAKCEDLISQANKDFCYRRFALETPKKAYCSEIEDQRNKAHCYYTFFDENDETLACDDIDPMQELLKNSCYSAAAIRFKDTSFCEKIVSSSNIKDICYRDVNRLSEE